MAFHVGSIDSNALIFGGPAMSNVSTNKPPKGRAPKVKIPRLPNSMSGEESKSRKSANSYLTGSNIKAASRKSGQDLTAVTNPLSQNINAAYNHGNPIPRNFESVPEKKRRSTKAPTIKSSTHSMPPPTGEEPKRKRKCNTCPLEGGATKKRRSAPKGASERIKWINAEAKRLGGSRREALRKAGSAWKSMKH